MKVDNIEYSVSLVTSEPAEGRRIEVLLIYPMPEFINEFPPPSSIVHSDATNVFVAVHGITTQVSRGSAVLASSGAKKPTVLAEHVDAAIIADDNARDALVRALLEARK